MLRDREQAKRRISHHVAMRNHTAVPLAVQPNCLLLVTSSSVMQVKTRILSCTGWLGGLLNRQPMASWLSTVGTFWKLVRIFLVFDVGAAYRLDPVGLLG